MLVSRSFSLFVCLFVCYLCWQNHALSSFYLKIVLFDISTKYDSCDAIKTIERNLLKHLREYNLCSNLLFPLAFSFVLFVYVLHFFVCVLVFAFC